MLATNSSGMNGLVDSGYKPLEGACQRICRQFIACTQPFIGNGEFR